MLRPLVTAVLGVAAVGQGLSCMDESGSSVDYWFAVKQPKGAGYVYYDKSSGALSLSSYSLNSTTEGALASTLTQLWSAGASEYIVFNDEPCCGIAPGSTSGHTKGVWAWDVSTGTAWILQHSVPIFPVGPSQSSSYSGLGSNAKDFAQHLQCFSLSLETLDGLAANAQLTSPAIYDKRTSASTPAGLAALAGGAVTDSADCNNQAFSTTGGLAVTYFAKSLEWDNELYDACIAPALQTDLAVESWIRGDACGPSCSGAYEVVDVKDLDFGAGAAFKFDEADDHSKWGVGIGSDWVCPADINRMTTQYNRGGSGFCYEDAVLAAAITAAITTNSTC